MASFKTCAIPMPALPAPTMSQGMDVFPTGPQCRQESRQGSGSCALNVIVETQMIVSILIEQGLCHGTLKVFKLDQGIGPTKAYRLHEFIHQMIIGASHQPWLLDTEIILILQEFWIVGTDIQHDGHDTMWSNATRGTVQGQLSNWNTHSLEDDDDDNDDDDDHKSQRVVSLASTENKTASIENKTTQHQAHKQKHKPS